MGDHRLPRLTWGPSSIHLHTFNMSSSAPLSIALMGAGIFAREQHLPAILSSNKFALKAVYSRSLKSAKELLKDAKGVESVDVYSEDSGEGKNLAALLNRDDIAAVDIVMPIFAQPKK